MAQDDYAIVVGVSQYPRFTLDKQLEGPDSDADDFVTWLLNEGAVPELNMKIFRTKDNPDSKPPQPNEFQIENDAVETWLCHFARTRAPVGRRLYIFMAGHGFSPSRYEACLFMANAAKDMTGHHLAGRVWASWFADAGYFKEVILFMDCCRVECQVSAHPFPVNRKTSSTPGKCFLGFATAWPLVAREGSLGIGGPVRGNFTVALLAGLRGGARVNGKITGKSLQAFVYRYFEEKHLDDEPKFDDTDFRPADIVFV